MLSGDEGGASGTSIGEDTVRALDTPPPDDKEAPGPELISYRAF